MIHRLARHVHSVCGSVLALLLDPKEPQQLYLSRLLLPLEINVARASVKVKSLTVDRAHPRVRGSPKSSIVVRMNLNQRARWTCSYAAVLMGITQLQPLTVKQELLLVEKVRGEQASANAREAHRGPRKGLLEQRLRMPCKAEGDTGVRVKVDQVGKAKSGPCQEAFTWCSLVRATVHRSETERAAPQARPPVLAPGA